MSFIKGTPGNMKKLKEMAADKTDWRKRAEAVHSMKRYDCNQVRDILTELAMNDRVYSVKREAYKAALALGVQVNGKPIYLGKKNRGYKPDDFKRICRLVRKESGQDKLDVDKFKEILKRLDPEMYDVMEYDKGKRFNRWIEEIYNM